jgi:hypothetical protein
MTETWTAISLHQPWASLIALGLKHHETRSWRYPARLEGQRLVIHAAKRRPTLAEVGPLLEAEVLFGHHHLPLGAYLCHGRLAGCYPTEEREPKGEPDRLAGDWSPGRFAWALEDIQPLEKPIPALGRQSLWSVQRALIEGDQT